MTREEAIKKLKDILEEATETDDADALKLAINSLEIDERYELEYEQAEPKTGHWYKKELQNGGWRCACSECDNNGRFDWVACPSCGAKMAESEDKE